MYETRFGFNGRPFVVVPSVEHYFPAKSIEHARTTIARAIERAEGPAMLIGASGTGKSLVCRLLEDQFKEQFRVAVLANARLATQRALLQNILFSLGLPYRDMDEGELRLSLIDHLVDHEACPNGMVLLVDEACALPLRLLEEIRMITNLVCGGAPRVRVVLAGGDRLEEKFVSPKLDSFNQRIVARCYLGPLSRDETMGYIRAQISGVGGDPSRLLDDEALIAVHRSTAGIPRLINQLCDHALILAAVEGIDRLDEQRIEQAWAELQQLPKRWSDSDNTASVVGDPSRAEGIIEFGELSSDIEPIAIEVDQVGAVIEQDGDAVAEDELAQRGDSVDDAPVEDGISHEATSDLEQLEPNVELLAAAPKPVATASEFAVNDQIISLEQDFQQEEVVIDRYAALDATFFQQRRQVASNESREIAAALATHWSVRLRFSTPATRSGEGQLIDVKSVPASTPMVETAKGGQRRPPQSAGDATEHSTHATVQSDVSSVADEVEQMQEMVSKTVQWKAIEPSEVAAGQTIVPEDDRDLILVEDAGGEGPIRKPVRAPRKPKRGQYRQLFAKLRRG